MKNVLISYNLYNKLAQENSYAELSETYDKFDTGNNVLENIVDSKTMKTATCEENFTLLDGKFSLYEGKPFNFGWWSKQQSDDKKTFDNPPNFTFHFTKLYTSAGLTIYFNSETEDYSDTLNITWYRDNKEIVKVNRTCNNQKCEIQETITDFNSIKIQFNSTNLPNRYIKIEKILIGLEVVFNNDSILSRNVFEEINLLSEEVSINTMDCSIVSLEDEFNILDLQGKFQAIDTNQEIQISADNHLLGTFFLQEWVSDSNSLKFEFKSSDAIVLLDNKQHLGGFYKNKKTIDLISEMLDGFEFEVHEDFWDIKINGYLPVDTIRNNLQQVCFTVGAIINVSRTNKIEIVKKSEVESKYINLESQLSSTIEKLTNYNNLNLTCYGYQLDSDTESEVFKGMLPYRSDNLVTFSSACKIKSIEGGIITDFGDNYAIVNTTENLPTDKIVVTITGNNYNEYTNIVNFPIYNNVSTLKDLNVAECTLISENNVLEVANNISEFYKSAVFKIKSTKVFEDEKIGDYIIIDTLTGYKVKGYIQSINLSIGAEILADLEIVGNRIFLDDNGIFLDEIYSGGASL